MRGRLVAVLAVAMALAGCGVADVPKVAQGDRPVAGYRQVKDPALASVDLTLPPGCSITDHDGGLAVYQRITGLQHPAETAGLLDLDTGEHREFLPAPAWATPGGNILNVKTSGSWVAWEEVSGGETGWRLYAAPIDRKTLRVGEALVVDEAKTAERSRPYLAVWGEAVVWCSTLGGAESASVLMTMELPSGRATEAWRTGERVAGVRVRDGSALVTLDSPDGGGLALAVVDLATGEAGDRIDLGDRGRPSHFADLEGETVAWATFESRERPWPVVTVMGAGDEARIACPSGCDPNIRGDLVAFETASAGPAGALHGLSAVDTSAGTLFDLAEPEPPESGIWQLVTAPSAPGGRLVAYRDASPYTEPGARALTEVRVWRLP